jgi:hypothetical protein
LVAAGEGHTVGLELRFCWGPEGGAWVLSSQLQCTPPPGHTRRGRASAAAAAGRRSARPTLPLTPHLLPAPTALQDLLGAFKFIHNPLLYTMHLTLYQTASRLYVVRQQSAGEEEFRVLKLDRTTAALEAVEDPTPYTKAQVQRLLATVHAGEAALRACVCRGWFWVASAHGCRPAHTHTRTRPVTFANHLPPCAGNQQHGGLQLVCEAQAIIGCVRFLEGWYLLLVTKRRYLGTICGVCHACICLGNYLVAPLPAQPGGRGC